MCYKTHVKKANNLNKTGEIKMKTLIRIGLLSLVTLFISSTIQEAFAELEEIVVTARKREESLQEIPLTVTAFDSAAIERNRIQDIIDVAKYTPGLTFDEGFVPQDSRPQIRGLPSDRGKPPVGILIDGIDVSSLSMLSGGGGMLANLRLLDIERIEVVKGPQSALYGRTAFGGAINYISKKPGDNHERKLSADVGDYGQFEIKGSVSGPVNDKVSLGINAAHSEHGGYYKNSLNDQDLGGYKSTGVALAAYMRPSDDFTINARIQYSEDEADPRAQTNLSRSTNTATAIPLPANAVGLLVPGAFGPAPLPATVTIPNPGKIRSSGAITLSNDPTTGQPFPGSTFDSFVSSIIIEYDLSDNVTFNSWTGYTIADFYQNQDVDFVGAAPAFNLIPSPPGLAEPLPFAFIYDLATKTKQFNQEIRIGDLESDGLRWAVGGLFWKENVDQQNNNLISLMFGLPGFIPSAAQNISAITIPPPSDEFRDTDHVSVYGILEYDISDQFSASLEARYSDESLDVGYIAGGRGANGFILPPFIPAPGAGAPIPVTVGPFTTGEYSGDYFTPRATLEYQSTDDVLIYASVSKGAKPGGISTVGSPANPDNTRYDPEKLWNYEIGTKTAWNDGKLILNAAGFYMDYSGKQVTLLEPNPNNPQGNDLVVRNAGKAEVYGVELEVVTAVTESLTVSAAYTYLDTEYTDFTLTTTSALGIAQAGNCTPFTLPTGTQACSTDFSGKPLDRAPKHALTVAANYFAPINNNWNLIVDLAAQYQSKRNQGPDALNFFGSYINVDGRIGFQSDEYTVVAYGENIFDNRTVKSGQGSGDFSALGNLAINTFEPAKAQFGVRVGYNF
ncbi:MAG: hypothetical protein CBC47_07005 [Alphaproteobacteria bacterium TMED87]|nr:hypothetical protein [Rhodospirillaceae bacterium]OUV08663.1 MAG: hypothetical protein CBC47_07005 [Alphaproteobacteria bacterium TMED87]